MKILDRVYTILVGLALLPDTAVTKPTMPPDIDEYLKTRSIYTPRPVTTPANLDYYPVLGGSNKRIADVLQYFPPCTIHVDWFYPAFASKDSNGNLKMSFYDFMNITILQGNDTLFASNIQLPNLPPAGPGISFAGPDSLVDITVDTPRIRGVKYPKLRAVPIHPEFRLQGAPVYSYVDRDHIRFFYGDRDNVHLTWNTDHNPDHNPDDPDQIKDYWRDEENRPYGCWYEKPLAGLEWGVNGSPQNIPSFKWHQPPPGITWIGGGGKSMVCYFRCLGYADEGEPAEEPDLPMFPVWRWAKGHWDDLWYSYPWLRATELPDYPLWTKKGGTHTPRPTPAFAPTRTRTPI